MGESPLKNDESQPVSAPWKFPGLSTRRATAPSGGESPTVVISSLKIRIVTNIGFIIVTPDPVSG